MNLTAESQTKMIIEFEHNGQRRQVDSDNGRSIAIGMDFDGAQPAHFGVLPASRAPLVSGEFTGRTSQGGSCNVDEIRLVPHCNGTHTETVGHIVNETVHIAEAAVSGLYTGLLVTLDPIPAKNTGETYRPDLIDTDLVLTRSRLQASLAKHNIADTQSLIIRTMPNDDRKCRRVYDEDCQPPFLTCEAMLLINEFGFQHLVVDFPSVDRIYDEGMLTNHHLYWNVPERTHSLIPESQTEKTITEMVYIPDGLKDGPYIVNLQIAPFCSDAAPSRPILYPFL